MCMASAPATSEHHELGDVFRTYHDFVWRSARRLGAGPATDDAVQEVFLLAARKLDELPQHAALKSWLFRATMHVVRNHRRGENRREARQTAAGELGRRSTDPSARYEAADELLKLLDLLHPDRRAVFVLAALEQMTAPEIAEVLDLNVNTVYSRLRTARSRLEQAIADRRAP